MINSTLRRTGLAHVPGALMALICALMLAACGGGGGGGGASVPEVPAPIAPTITQQPATVTVLVGAAASFTVTATGDGPISYQWRRDGVDVAGATSPTITLASTTAADSGSKWTVVVRNNAGSSVSVAATLVVTSMPAISVVTSAATGRAIALDRDGNAFLCNSIDGTILKVTPAGVVTTLSSNPGRMVSRDGPIAEARFLQLGGIAVDGAGNIYVTDSGTIRKITPAGMVSTIAGRYGYAGAADGAGAVARFYLPIGLAVDATDNLYVADMGNNTIRRVSTAGEVTTLAGSPLAAGSQDGTGADARFDFPVALAVDSGGNIYVAEGGNTTTASFFPATGNNMIRRISPGGAVTTIAGASKQHGSADGNGSSARFRYPSGIAVDKAGNVFVADSYNHTIRKITPQGDVTTVAGVAGVAAIVPGTLPGGLLHPTSLAIAADGALLTTSGGSVLRIMLP